MTKKRGALEAKQSFNYLCAAIPPSLKLKFDGKELNFSNDGDRPIDQVSFAMRGGQAIAFKWHDNGQPVEGYAYLGPWQNEKGDVRGKRYVVFCLRNRTPTVEVNLDKSFELQSLLYAFNFSIQDRHNLIRRKEALALAQEAHMETHNDKLVLGRWDTKSLEFTEGATEIFRRLVWAALAKDKLRRNKDFRSSSEKTRLKSGRSRQGNSPNRHSSHHAMGKLKPSFPKADEEYLAKTASTEKYKSRSHARLQNELFRFVKMSGLEPKENKAIDLATVSRNGTVVFEIKVTPPVKPLRAIREAVGQLYEYRYFGVVQKQSFLCLVTPHKPTNEILHYLENDRQIGVLWEHNGDFWGNEWSREQLKEKGYKFSAKVKK